MKPFSPSINPFNPNFRATIGSKLREWIDDSGIGGGYRQGLINAGEGIETGIDFTPIVGDAVGIGDIRTSYNQGDMVGTGINTVAAAVGALPIIGDVAAKGVKSTGSALRDLYFLHNTTPEALARYDQLGGLPAPSIAVTQEDIPFENFGDITLIGRPERFDPEADKANTMYRAATLIPLGRQTHLECLWMMLLIELGQIMSLTNLKRSTHQWMRRWRQVIWRECNAKQTPRKMRITLKTFLIVRQD
jgi:hypothetical protein